MNPANLPTEVILSANEEDLYTILRRVRDWITSRFDVEQSSLPKKTFGLCRSIYALCYVERPVSFSAIVHRLCDFKLISFSTDYNSEEITFNYELLTNIPNLLPPLPNHSVSLSAHAASERIVQLSYEDLTFLKICHWIHEQFMLNNDLPSTIKGLNFIITRFGQLKLMIDPKYVVQRLITMGYIKLMASSNGWILYQFPGCTPQGTKRRHDDSFCPEPPQRPAPFQSWNFDMEEEKCPVECAM